MIFTLFFFILYQNIVSIFSSPHLTEKQLSNTVWVALEQILHFKVDCSNLSLVHDEAIYPVSILVMLVPLILELLSSFIPKYILHRVLELFGSLSGECKLNLKMCSNTVTVENSVQK